MSVRRLTSMLAALLTIAGLSLLPTASPARTVAPASHRAVDDPSQTDQGGEVDDETFDDSTDESADLSDDDLLADDGADDSCLVVDDGADQGDETDFGDDTSDDSGTDDGADLREAAPDDPGSGDEEDPAADDEGGDFAGDESDGTDLTDACALELSDDDILDDVDGSDAADLGKNGSFTQTYTLPEGGTIDETLTSGSGARAVVAKIRIVGQAHRKVAKAGQVKVRIKLNKQGRKALRTARRALHLTLRTRIALKSGRTIKRTKTLTVKPKQHRAKSKGKHRKPARPKRH